MEAGQDQSEEPEKYSFLQEKIKDETKNRRKTLYKLSFLIGRGLLFGAAACVSFVTLKPWVQSVVQGNPNEIQLPKEEIRAEGIDKEIEIEKGTEKDKGKDKGKGKENGDGKENGNRNGKQNENEKQNENNREQEGTEQGNQKLTVSHYQEWNELLIQVADEAKKSIVQVSTRQREEIFLEEIQDSTEESSGVIIGDNGQELLILTNMSVLKDATKLQVTFYDNSQCDAVLKNKDQNLGFVVIGVNKTYLHGDTMSKIKVAELGNSNAIGQGKTVIALGSPFGYSDGVGIGFVSSKERNRMLADGEYSMLVTNMPMTSRSSGILVDIEGKVAGIIVPTEKEDGEMTLTAFGVSTIKRELELMLNAKDVPYVGIVGELVPKEITQQKEIPEGICVTKVMPDSPAMKAGIQNGDIITHINKMKIESLFGYHSTLLQQSIGEEIRLKGKRRGAEGEGYVEIDFSVTIELKE